MDKHTYDVITSRFNAVESIPSITSHGSNTPLLGRTETKRLPAPYKLFEEAREVMGAWHRMQIEPGSENTNHFLSELLDVMGVIQIWIDINTDWYTLLREINAMRPQQGKTEVRLT